MATKEIRIGERFISYTEFEEALRKYEDGVFANFNIKASVKDNTNNLRYKWVRFKCKLAGEHIKTTHQRNTSSYRQGCSAFIYVVQKTRNNVNALEVVTVNDIHNHMLSADLYKHMTKQRKRAVDEQKEHLEKVLSVKSNLKAVQKQVNVQNTSLGVITLRDLHNFKNKMKEEDDEGQNDLVQLLHQMIKIESATVRIVKSHENELECIYFQDERMKHFFKSYPELVLFDGTYKLNNRRIPLVIMLIVDGNGESQIAGLCLVRSENVRTFRQMFEIFKDENDKYVSIEVIMSDKSFANRNAFKASFPHAEHQLCVFHVLQIFNREITTKKRNIGTDEKNQALRIMQRMVYAQSEIEYTEHYRKLRALDCEQVTEYFDNNWHNIQEQWVGYHVNRHLNFENRTNNRLESLNQKIKAVVSKYANLATFFEDLITCITSFNIERDHVAADSVLRQTLTTITSSEYDKKYAKLLTKYAYDKYKLQSMKMSQVNFTKIANNKANCVDQNTEIAVSDTNCNCPFFKTMRLPCAHIIALFVHRKVNPFKPDLCAQRWKRENAQYASEFSYSCDSISTIQLLQLGQTPARRNMNCNEKFRIAETESKKICEIMAEKPQIEYDAWLQQLKNFRHDIEHKILPTIPQNRYIENASRASNDASQNIGTSGSEEQSSREVSQQSGAIGRC